MLERYWHDESREWKPLTNYQFIMTMSPEALAEFLSKEFCDGQWQQSLLEWLYQERSE